MTLGASATVLSRLQAVPAGVWLRIAVAVIALVLLVLVIRKVAKMNKIILAILVALVCTMIGFNWLYERNEPKWATPVVEKLATFFPTKNSMK